MFLRNTKGERARFKKANLGNRKWSGWVHLQSYGKAPAVLVSDLKVGDYILYNYGYKSQVKSITPKGKASVVVETESAKDGKIYDRTYRLKSLIPILSDRQIQIHQRLKRKGYAAETKTKDNLPLSFSTHSVNSALCIASDPYYSAGLCYDETNHKVDRTGNIRGSHGSYGEGEPSCVHCKRVWKKMTDEDKEAWKKAFIDWNDEYEVISFEADEEFYEEYPAKYYQTDEDEGVFYLPATDSYWVVQGEDALTKEQSKELAFGAEEEFYEEYPAKYYQTDEDEGVFYLPATDSYWVVQGEDALTKEQSKELAFGAEAGTYRINWKDGKRGVTFDYEGGDDMHFDDTWTDLFWDASNPQVTEAPARKKRGMFRGKRGAESFNAVVIAPEKPKGIVEKALVNHYLFQESTLRQALMEIENRVELGLMSVEEAEKRLNRLMQQKMQSENYAAENTSKKLLSGVFMLVAVASLWRAVTVTEDTYLFPKENKYMTILGSASIGLGILAWKGDSILAALED